MPAGHVTVVSKLRRNAQDVFWKVHGAIYGDVRIGMVKDHCRTVALGEREERLFVCCAGKTFS